MELPEGYTVRYTHHRNGEVKTNCCPLPARGTKAELARVGARILPNGGETLAVIFNELGDRVSMGLAECREDETFVPSMGRTIALGRALKMLV